MTLDIPGHSQERIKEEADLHPRGPGLKKVIAYLSLTSEHVVLTSGAWTLNSTPLQSASTRSRVIGIHIKL